MSDAGGSVVGAGRGRLQLRRRHHHDGDGDRGEPPYSTTGRARRREATHVILPAADPAAGAARAVSRDPGPGLAREGRGPEGFLPRLSVAVPRGLAHP